MTTQINQSLIKKHLESESLLQIKYLHSQDNKSTRQNQFLCIFLSSMKEQSNLTTMNKTSLGSTGYTFLCSLPSSAIPHEKIDQVIRFVLKWQSPAQNNVEIMGSYLFRFLGFKAPIPVPITKDTVKKELTGLAKSIAPSLSSEMDPILMPTIHANNLASFIKNEKIFKLSDKQIRFMLREIGKIAIGDLLIGNDDRTFSFSYDPDQKKSEQIHFNGGNLLIASEETTRNFFKIKAVYPIDNCPSPKLVERPKTTAFPLEDGFGSLFGEEETQDEQSSDDHTLTQGGQSKETLSSSLNPDDQIEWLHTRAVFFIQHLGTFASLIRHGINKEIFNITGEHHPLISTPRADKALVSGMELALEKTSRKNINQFKFNCLDKNQKRIRNLFEINLEFLQDYYKL